MVAKELRRSRPASMHSEASRLGNHKQSAATNLNQPSAEDLTQYPLPEGEEARGTEDPSSKRNGLR